MTATGAVGLAACALAAAVPACAAAPFDGRWAADAPACGGESAAVSLVIINSLSLRWREATCLVRTSYRVGGAWHVGARCWGEGAVSNVPISLRMRGDQLLLDWAGAPAEELRRCP